MLNDLPSPKNDTLSPAASASGTRRLFVWLFGFIFSAASLLAVLAFMWGMSAIRAPGPLKESATIIIARGESTRAIAEDLKAKGVIRHATLFRVAARLLAHNALKAGEYRFTPRQSMTGIVAVMREGKSIMHKFTVAEGLTSAEVVQLLQATPNLTGTIALVPPEGSLRPETYDYSFGDSRAALIARMQKSMKAMLEKLWAGRDPSIALTSPEQAVILASIIEKETGKPAERSRIAGIFYNRLRYNMRLQSDPTVIYGIEQAKGSMDHRIDHADLSFPSPYNTYLNDGLPPAPICNPGRAALRAALHPESNNYLYFVADGTGGHVFSSSLAAHNHNVENLRREETRPLVKPKSPAPR